MIEDLYNGDKVFLQGAGRDVEIDYQKVNDWFYVQYVGRNRIKKFVVQTEEELVKKVRYYKRQGLKQVDSSTYFKNKSMLEYVRVRRTRGGVPVID